MRPIYLVLAVVLIFIGFICFGNFLSLQQSETNEDVRGQYSYGGNTLVISTYSVYYGNTPVTMTQTGLTSYNLQSTSKSFPSGKYNFIDGNLVGENSGVTFLRRG